MVNSILKHRGEIIILLILIASYFVLRLPNLTLQPIFADEAIYIRWAQVMRAEPTLRFLPLSDGKTPLFMWMMMPLFKIFSDPLFVGRFLSVILGLFTLLGVFSLSKKVFNKQTACWASLLYVVTPYTVFFDRMALVDSMLTSFTIWIVYFSIWLSTSLRLDLAMILGFLLGGAWLTKTPAILNLFILPITLLGIRKNVKKNTVIKHLILLGISILIALTIYNLLRLGPEFQQLSRRNADYMFSINEVLKHLLDPFIPHFHDISDWFPKLLTLPNLILMGLGAYFVVVKFNRFGIIILLWSLIPILVQMALLKTFTARYLLPSQALFIVLAGFGLYNLLNRVKIFNLGKTIIALSIILPMSLVFDYQLLTNPPPQSLPKAERRGYFEDWTAGYGFKDIAQFLLEKSKSQKVVVGTEGFFGTLPDGLQIYLDKSNISIIGSSPIVSEQIRKAAKENSTFFVINKRRSPGVADAILIKEYPKAKPQDDSPQDAILFYEILPK